MPNKDLLMNISILYRLTQKHLDQNLLKYNIGAGQLLFLLFINEHQGLKMQELTTMGAFDKGTTTKSISKLEDTKLIYIENDCQDKRIKRLYTTSKAEMLMKDFYQILNKTKDLVIGDLNQQQCIELMDALAYNSLMNTFDYKIDVLIVDMDAFNLKEYDGYLNTTIYLADNNYKCSYSRLKHQHTKKQVDETLKSEDVLQYLQEKQGSIQSVTIKGGEPLIQQGIVEFLNALRKMDYKIKLETNGHNIRVLKQILENNLVDYISMDIVNSKEKYLETSGLSSEEFSLEIVDQAISLIKHSGIDYEFKTIAQRQLHTLKDLKDISVWIQEHYYIYCDFMYQEDSYSVEELKQIGLEVRG